MREGAKKRLIGAVVIVALAVIFVPMLFEPQPLERLPPIQQSIPRPPAFEAGLGTETFLGPHDSGVGEVDPSVPRVSQPLALPPAADPGAGVPVEPPPARPEPAARPVPPRAGAAEPAPARPAEAPAPGGGKGAARGGAGSWVIQVASIPSASAAAELEGRLKAGGYPAFVEKAEVNGKVTYRIKVGPESDRARAEQTAARLRDKHKVQPLIRNYP